MIESVDPFIGTGPTDLPAPAGLAASWWWPKPPIGNTHPGATHPFGMVSACSYSGGYPTGYGGFERSLEGPPRRLHDDHVTRGFTHFQQSGTGAIRRYYNYLKVTPLMGTDGDVSGIDEPITVIGEEASPGWYRTVLANGIEAELTVGPSGIPEAVGPHAKILPPGHPAAIANTLSEINLGLSAGERSRWGRAARSSAMQFDRANVFDRLLGHVAEAERDRAAPAA